MEKFMRYHYKVRRETVYEDMSEVVMGRQNKRTSPLAVMATV
jgi:hypothetical protein